MLSPIKLNVSSEKIISIETVKYFISYFKLES